MSKPDRDTRAIRSRDCGLSFHWLPLGRKRLSEKSIFLKVANGTTRAARRTKRARPFFEQLKMMGEKEIQKVVSAPYLPMFILNEMHSNPERAQQCLGAGHRHTELFNTFREVVEKEQSAGRIRPVCPRQLFLSILGLTMFPFLAQPMLEMAFDIDHQSFDQLVANRVAYVGDMLVRSLQVQTT